MPRLVELLRASGDGPLQASALWAVKNLVRKASKETKRDVMQCVGWSELLGYVHFISVLVLRTLIIYFRRLNSLFHPIVSSNM